MWAGCFRRGRPIIVEPLHTKILTHLYGGLPCPARCSLAGEAVAVAPSGRLYPCAQMIAEDEGDTLVIGTAFAGLDRNKLAKLLHAIHRLDHHPRRAARPTVRPTPARLRALSLKGSPAEARAQGAG